MAQPDRPRFSPEPCLSNGPWEPLKFSKRNSDWVPVCSCPANFPVESFETAISNLINHPEYNSTLILRSDIIEKSDKLTSEDEVPAIENFRFVKNIRRRLLPRRPGRDSSIEQDCTFYSAPSPPPTHDVHDLVHESEAGDDNEALVSCVVLTPKLADGGQMPFYHPAVFHIAFRYLQTLKPSDDAILGASESQLRIEVVLWPNAPDPKDVNSRLYRTCMSLLETVHRYGATTNYRKRAHHDCIISREEYQDLYLIMRERYKHLVNRWHENTDPLKHVFEDVAIATYIMLLWKQDTNETSAHRREESSNGNATKNKPSERMPWHDWSRPQGGFLDLGCGNGLVVHILVSEGYAGEGIDIRARNSWQHYPPETQAHLHVHALNPLQLPISLTESIPMRSSPFLRPGTFIIANHADELSPWTPVLATLTGASGFLSIPCCSWSFDARFERKQRPLDNPGKPDCKVAFSFACPDGTDIHSFVESLRLRDMGGSNRGSVYSAFRVWLACLGVHCGWAAESDDLRIPSTRNWALIGRRRCGNDAQAINNALTIIDQVRGRGLFKTRKPEGKADEPSHGH